MPSKTAGMERRSFLKNSCGACAALGFGTFFLSSLMESCKVTAVSLYKTNSSDNKISVPLTSFSENDFKLIRISNYNYDVGVVKLESGGYLALLLRCTHAGQALTKAGSGYFCPLHGSRFSQIGDVVKGPATSPLQHLPVKAGSQNLIIALNPEYFSS